MKINIVINHSFKRKIVTAVFVTASLVTFAALGDGKKDDNRRSPHKSLLSNNNSYNFKTFSLKSRYNYRGSNIISSSDKYITLNTIATYQKGNTTYILPMKKKILLEKIKFNPAH